MRSSDLYGTRSKFRVRVFVGDDRDEPLGNGQADEFTDQIPVALIRRVHGHRTVTQHRLGPSGGDDNFGDAVNGSFNQRIGE